MLPKASSGSIGTARARRLVALALSFVLAACGGEQRPSPVSPTTPSVPMPPSTLALVSGETGEPVGGATVVIGGQNLRADSQGQVGVPGGSALGTFVDLVSPAFLDRQTVLREGSGPLRLSLWPRMTPSGMDENFTATLVYTSTVDGALVGGQALRRHRPSVTAVYLALSAALRADSESVAWHQLAADSINVAVGGKVVYQLSTAPPAGAVVVDASYDPSNAGCAGGSRGFASLRLSAGEILGGTIVYCAADAPRSPTVVHELGHSFGLFHSPDRSDLMYFSFVRGRSEVFTAKETLAMRLMLDRPSGTRYPDNDRSTSGAAVRGQDGLVEIRCSG